MLSEQVCLEEAPEGGQGLSSADIRGVSMELCVDLFVFTGILWNLSSKDNLKDKLASETLPELTERVLVPLSQSDNQQSASESEIFYNTTGCLSNGALQVAGLVPIVDICAEQGWRKQ
ncbi:UNVERIFIED_CONTAM: hypothetical protein FKN15_067953 [Acipenser sinensis]